MLPTATHTRKDRETRYQTKWKIDRNFTFDWSSICVLSYHLENFGERTIVVDCDVVQADGGTRTACISGAYLALKLQLIDGLQSGKISETILQ